MNKLFSDENELVRSSVAGSATCKHSKQFDIVLSLKVSLFIQFIQSLKQKVCVFSLFRDRK